MRQKSVYETRVYSYERQSNIAAGLCADCMKPLKPDEIHVCQKCDEAFIECDPNARMTDENEQESIFR